MLGYRSAAVWVAGGVRRLLLLARRVLLQIDWSLIFVFAAMFIDVGLFTRLPPLQPAFAAIAGLSDGGVYALGVGLSQIVSNVPATILLLNYVPASAQLAYAVNAGGFGLAVGSLANLIALRMAGSARSGCASTITRCRCWRGPRWSAGC